MGVLKKLVRNSILPLTSFEIISGRTILRPTAYRAFLRAFRGANLKVRFTISYSGGFFKIPE
jgi:hypothetical protein